MTEVTRRDFLGRLAGGAAAVAVPGALSAAETGKPSPKQPNVIVVFNDQLRSVALGAYGGANIATPHIDRMAQEGMIFANAVSSCPLCAPFRGMLMTGRYPTHSGIVLNSIRANGKQRCIAHVFGEAGYHTGFIGKFHLYYPRSHNFIPLGPARLGFEHWEAYNFQQTFMNTPYYRDDETELRMNGYEMDAEIDMAIRFISQCKASGKPFFLVVAPHPPHGPRNEANTPKGYVEQTPENLQWPPNCEPSPGAQRQAIYYYAMIKNADDNMGRLIQFLDQEDLSKDTILVYTADHGDMLDSHGLKGKSKPYAESVKIPMIARWPGHIRAGVKTDALHTPLDHMPTLCALAGLKPPATADGLDLSPLLLGKAEPERDAVLMANYCASMSGFQTGEPLPEWRAVKTKQHTYIKWLSGKEALYDDLADPYQMADLAAEPSGAPTLQTLRARLAERMAEAHDEFLPGTAYAEWYDKERNLLKTALGPI